MERTASGRVNRRRRITGKDDALARALVSAIPTPNPDAERTRQRIVLPGDPPSPIDPPAGCSFHPRCSHAQEKCKAALPPLQPDGPTREVACVRLGEI